MNEVRVDIPNTVVANRGASVYHRYKKTIAVSMLAASVAAVLVTLAAKRGIKVTPETEVPIATVRAAEAFVALNNPPRDNGARFGSVALSRTPNGIAPVVLTRKIIDKTTPPRLTTEEMIKALEERLVRDAERLPHLGVQALDSVFATFGKWFVKAKP